MCCSCFLKNHSVIRAKVRFISVAFDPSPSSTEMEHVGSLEFPEEEITAIFFEHQKNYERNYNLTGLSIL